jgi:hypothetical protein
MELLMPAEGALFRSRESQAYRRLARNYVSHSAERQTFARSQRVRSAVKNWDDQ